MYHQRHDARGCARHSHPAWSALSTCARSTKVRDAFIKYRGDPLAPLALVDLKRVVTREMMKVFDPNFIESESTRAGLEAERRARQWAAEQAQRDRRPDMDDRKIPAVLIAQLGPTKDANDKYSSTADWHRVTVSRGEDGVIDAKFEPAETKCDETKRLLHGQDKDLARLVEHARMQAWFHCVTTQACVDRCNQQLRLGAKVMELKELPEDLRSALDKLGVQSLSAGDGCLYRVERKAWYVSLLPGTYSRATFLKHVRVLAPPPCHSCQGVAAGGRRDVQHRGGVQVHGHHSHLPGHGGGGPSWLLSARAAAAGEQARG